jgi:hypothetical protein
MLNYSPCILSKLKLVNRIMYILYIDPGTGSLLFQALLSGFLTIVVFFKRIMAFLKLKFGRKEQSNKEDESHDPS